MERLTREPVVSPATALGIVGKIDAGLAVSRQERDYVSAWLGVIQLQRQVAVRKRLLELEVEVKRMRSLR